MIGARLNALHQVPGKTINIPLDLIANLVAFYPRPFHINLTPIFEPDDVTQAAHIQSDPQGGCGDALE
jgi:hypothetical protein